MPLIAKLIIDGICGVLFSIGGAFFLPARRFIMPFVLGVAVSVFTGSLWTGLMILPVMLTLCIGYKNGKWLIRGLWMALQAFVIGIGLFLTHFLAWYLYFPYVILCGIMGGAFYEVEQIISDFLFGISLGAILFLVH